MTQVSLITPEQLASLKRVLNNFDHCCWSRDEHYAVLEQLAEQGKRIETLGEKLDQAQRLCAECGKGFLDTDWAMERKELEKRIETLTQALREASGWVCTYGCVDGNAWHEKPCRDAKAALETSPQRKSGNE